MGMESRTHHGWMDVPALIPSAIAHPCPVGMKMGITAGLTRIIAGLPTRAMRRWEGLQGHFRCMCRVSGPGCCSLSHPPCGAPLQRIAVSPFEQGVVDDCLMASAKLINLGPSRALFPSAAPPRPAGRELES